MLTKEQKIAQNNYRKSPSGKEVMSRYDKSPKGKEVKGRYRKSLKGRKVFSRANSKYLKKIRMNILQMLNNKCSRCGFSDLRALQIDHIEGGGNKQRKELGRNYLKHIEESVKSGLGEYQLLCANCNWIKRAENDEVGGVREV